MDVIKGRRNPSNETPPPPKPPRSASDQVKTSQVRSFAAFIPALNDHTHTIQCGFSGAGVGAGAFSSFPKCECIGAKILRTSAAAFSNWGSGGGSRDAHSPPAPTSLISVTAIPEYLVRLPSLLAGHAMFGGNCMEPNPIETVSKGSDFAPASVRVKERAQPR
jgi:hypothetical protein